MTHCEELSTVFKRKSLLMGIPNTIMRREMRFIWSLEKTIDADEADEKQTTLKQCRTPLQEVKGERFSNKRYS